MASYRGLALNVDVSGTAGFVPRWRREPNVVHTHIPGANADRVQVLGRGNPLVTLRLYFTSDADYAALEAMLADGLTGTLDDPFGDGLSYAGVGLVDLSDPVRRSYLQEWEAAATFEQPQ
jgi:hypothetical protein